MYGSSFKMVNSFQWITECLIEIIDKFIIVSQDCDLFVKSKKWTSVYVLIELINSLISYYDRKSAKLESKNTDSTFKAVQRKDDKSSPKGRMKTRIIFNFIDNLSTSLKWDEKVNKLMKFLWERIECFIDYILAWKGSITVSSSFDKSIVWRDSEDDASLIKIRDTESSWR